ncbi:DUF3298 and DUF4163 domain-containing protein [Paenibacillus wynnii]|uniref:DUF3298 and DUF4163 domain-containing protein n=1 Tax=Paenibacillus wynnii TaxID=268407 RepID=UPI00278EC7DC|nr:DUF3298 and DUF4163 domain-containing protein [Paenibacillus wynnii]MDQ0194384.1 hypothetical protein [Paenibacillus wynnii]
MRKHLFKVLLSVFSFLLLLYPLQELNAATSSATVKTNTYKGQPIIQITQPNNSKSKAINSILKNFAVSAAMQDLEAKQENSEYWYRTTTKLMYNKNNKLSVSNETSYYSGGAHDQYWTDTYNFDTTTGKRIFLKDILNSQTKIDRAKGYISYVLFYKLIKGTASIFENNIYDFPLDTLKAPFYLRDSGITIRFNPYEVGPFSEGIIDVTIPYSIINGQTPVPEIPVDTD